VWYYAYGGISLTSAAVQLPHVTGNHFYLPRPQCSTHHIHRGGIAFYDTALRKRLFGTTAKNPTAVQRATVKACPPSRARPLFNDRSLVIVQIRDRGFGFNVVSAAMARKRVNERVRQMVPITVGLYSRAALSYVRFRRSTNAVPPLVPESVRKRRCRNQTR